MVQNSNMFRRHDFLLLPYDLYETTPATILTVCLQHGQLLRNTAFQTFSRFHLKLLIIILLCQKHQKQCASQHETTGKPSQPSTGSSPRAANTQPSSRDSFRRFAESQVRYSSSEEASGSRGEASGSSGADRLSYLSDWQLQGA